MTYPLKLAHSKHLLKAWSPCPTFVFRSSHRPQPISRHFLSFYTTCFGTLPSYTSVQSLWLQAISEPTWMARVHDQQTLLLNRGEEEPVLPLPSQIQTWRQAQAQTRIRTQIRIRTLMRSQIQTQSQPQVTIPTLAYTSHM